MYDLSAPADPSGYVDSTQEAEWNPLHAQRGIGKGKGSGVIHIWYRFIKNILHVHQAFVV